MRFGGHETFTIREGWLHKGLRLLVQSPDQLNSDDAADWLGVGRNMAKSIRHWLLATGLAEYAKGTRGKARRLVVSDCGRVVWKNDSHFLDMGTLWALHVNLVQDREQAYTWHWFFNRFNAYRFERALCLDALQRHMRLEGVSSASERTLERDIACLLGTYARPIPPQQRDPEEAQECPFTELGLMTHHRASGYFELNRREKDIPPEILAYCISLTASTTEVPVRDASYSEGGPGKTFVLTAEALFDLALRAEQAMSGNQLSIIGLAGERVIKLAQKPPLEWLKAHYDRASSG